MAEITAALVKELRERTQAGMSDCKNALVEAGGDLDKAVEVILKKGIVKAASRAGLVLVAVKPQVVPEVLAEIAPRLRPGTLVVSVAAGVPLAVYEAALPEGTPVVRVMPNTPALVGKGASAIAPGAHATEEHLALTERVLAATGLVVRVPEKDLDAVTA